jgi:glycine/D-amino acid oxidase-like deaminating enzyme
MRAIGSEMTQDVKEFETWYEATTARGVPRPPLHADAQAEVCVIGGGLAGIATAHELSRRGKSVILIEAKRLAWGASGRNGGFVSDGFALGATDLAVRVGLKDAQSLYGLSRLGTETVRRNVGRLGHTLKMGDGWIVVLRHDDPFGFARWAERMAEDFDQHVEFLTTAQTRMVLRSERYFQGVRYPDAFHIHPLRYALALASEAETHGARIYEQTPALSIEAMQGGYVVRTGEAKIRAAQVVTCVSSLDRRIDPQIGRAVLPVATYVAVTAPIVSDAILTASAVADTRRAGDYYRLISDSRLLWGGRITTQIRPPAHLAERMKGDMLSVYPQLGNPSIDYAWAGVMGYALHKMPLIGQSRPGRWHATAFGGHGLNTTAMAGVLIARAICERDDEYRRFAAFPPNWVGGPFGRIGVQGSYWYMQMRDALDEARSRRSVKKKEAIT